MIAETRETFPAATTIWSEGQYEHHWKATASAAGQSDLLVFVTSLEPPTDLTAVWALRRSGDAFIAMNMLVRSATLAIAGDLAAIDDLNPADFDDPSVSRWRVTAEELADFARA